jgi:acyl carrier protein
MMAQPEIFERLKSLIAEMLGVAPDAVRPESVLVSDLGAESIDLLDLSFQIEEIFNVTIESNEIEREAMKRLPGGVYESDGRLTDQALAEIRKALPELDTAKLVPGVKKMDIPSLLTVQFFVKLIERKLRAKMEAGNA